jgi:hypothetical protein
MRDVARENSRGEEAPNWIIVGIADGVEGSVKSVDRHEISSCLQA